MKKSLKQFIADVEASHFRTDSDTGANWHAMFMWNLVRQHAGMKPLENKDLPTWCENCHKYHVRPLCRFVTNLPHAVSQYPL